MKNNKYNLIIKESSDMAINKIKNSSFVSKIQESILKSSQIHLGYEDSYVDESPVFFSAYNKYRSIEFQYDGRIRENLTKLFGIFTEKKINNVEKDRIHLFVNWDSEWQSNVAISVFYDWILEGASIDDIEFHYLDIDRQNFVD